MLRDFLAAEVKYHSSCYTKFLMGRREPDDVQRGRPAGTFDPEKHPDFERLRDIIGRSDECQFSVTELEKILKESGTEGYNWKTLIAKLRSHPENGIITTEIAGKPTVINFSGFAKKLLHENWHTEKKNKEEDETRRITKLAARLIKVEILCVRWTSTRQPRPCRSRA